MSYTKFLVIICVLMLVSMTIYTLTLGTLHDLIPFIHGFGVGILLRNLFSKN